MDTSQTPVTYSQPASHNHSADNWDDDEPAQPPVQAVHQHQSNNRFNNNKTPNYEAASKTPIYASNKTPSHVSQDDDWDDDRPPAVSQINTTANRFANNKTPIYAPNKTPSHISQDDDWDNDRSSAVAQVNTTANRFANNKTPIYAPNKTPSHVSQDDDWDEERPSAVAQVNITANRFANNKTPSYAPPVAENPWDADERRPNNNRGNGRGNVDDWSGSQGVSNVVKNVVAPAAVAVRAPVASGPVSNKSYVDEDDWDD